MPSTLILRKALRAVVRILRFPQKILKAKLKVLKAKLKRLIKLISPKVQKKHDPRAEA
jgi:hypothetical protein